MFWFKASTQSAGCSNLRAEITAEQGLSDSIKTDPFAFLWLMTQSIPAHLTHGTTVCILLYFGLIWERTSAFIFLPCCRWHFPKWKKLLCLLFQDSSALDASLRLLGNNITIQYVENKQMQNPLLFVFLAHPDHMELGSYTNTALISNISLTQGAFWHSSQTWNCFSQTLCRHLF